MRVARGRDLLSAKLLRSSFDRLDENGDGFVSRAELQRLLERAGSKLAQAQRPGFGRDFKRFWWVFINFSPDLDGFSWIFVDFHGFQIGLRRFWELPAQAAAGGPGEDAPKSQHEPFGRRNLRNREVKK